MVVGSGMQMQEGVRVRWRGEEEVEGEEGGRRGGAYLLRFFNVGYDLI